MLAPRQIHRRGLLSLNSGTDPKIGGQEVARQLTELQKI
jgi:hypothetical protein